MTLIKRYSFALMMVLLTSGAIGGAALAGTIAPGLQAQLADLQDEEQIKVLVVLRERVDITTLDQDLHLQRVTLAVRHQIVIDELKQVAAASQGDLIADLDSRMGRGEVAGYTPHWLINAVVVVATADAVREIAARDDVMRVEPDLVPELIEPVESRAAMDPPADRGIGITPGLVAIGARRVWDELGIRGEGVIVGNLDTGVDGNHPALAARWRGNFADPSECWLDIVGNGSPAFPVDYNSHGTHVMGTITGLADDDTIGVAPGALWIATNVIDQGVSPGFDNDVIVSLEFMTDPDGDPSTLDDVPDVVQNSWRINENFPGGYVDCDSRWWDAIDACEAAGVVLTWSAGNEGPGSQTVGSPADRATSPYNTFSVGSTVTYAPYNISGFSSRGPAGPNCGPVEYRIKPEICAPGSDIYSSEPNGSYGYKSGTSMSGPHIAGVVALMRSANPNLDVITIKQVLMETAIDLGATGEDNVYGHGFVDAYAAVLTVMEGIGYAEGTVTDVFGDPIPSTTLQVVGGYQSATTDADGWYRLTLAADEVHTVSVTAFGYISQIIEITVPEDDTAIYDLVLVPTTRALLSGHVYDPEGALVLGAEVTASNTPLPAEITDENGFYEMWLPVNMSYDMEAAAAGLGTDYAVVDVFDDTVHDFHLPPYGGGTPALVVSTGDVFYKTVPGGHGEKRIVVSNGGDAVLTYRFRAEEVDPTMPIAERPEPAPHLELAKGEPDPRIGVPPNRGQGGPDDFGSDEPGGPVYDWFDIADIGNFVGGGDDASHGPFNLGFPFLYYDQTFTSVRVCTNGFLSFTSAADPYTNQGIPDTAQPNNMLAPFWDDLNPNSGGTIYYYNDVAGNRFIVQWDGVPHYSGGGPETFQCIINADGSIIYQYHTVDTGNSCTVGIEDASGTDGLEILFNASGYLHDEMAIFVSAFPPVPWLSIEPFLGSIPDGGSAQQVSLLFDAGDLAMDTYHANLLLTSNDPENELTIIPVTFVVGDVTAVETPEARALQLVGAVPNPFNPSTEIRYVLPSEGRVELAIYDVMGRLVRSLVSEVRPAGENAVRWNGQDNNGRGVASGTYYARLQMGQQASVKSLVLVR